MAETSSGAPVRILSIDGGGIRGILPARVLQYIEAKAGTKIAKLFDLIAGTSTGGILGCGLFKGKSAKDLGDLYAQKGGDIFAHSLWRTVRTVGGVEGARYDATTLETILGEVLGDARLSDAPVGAELLVPTYVIQLPKPIVVGNVPTTRNPMLFKTWKARGVGLASGERKEMFDFALKDVARATSAAPTYFAPAQYKNSAGDTYASVDGGLFANNPALCALVAAYKRYGKSRRYILVSLGTGSLERPIPYDNAKGWGDLQWLHPVLSMLMDGNADTISYEADQVLDDDHFRFEISTGLDPKDPATVNEDFDCATPDNVARLERLAASLIEKIRPRLDPLIPRLSEEVPST